VARRFETFYRVKTKDNLGDPEYWNRRFDDVDRRISGNEDGLSNLAGLSAEVEGLALDRLNLVLAPALARIGLVSEQGFLLAHSGSSVTLTEGATVTFVIEDEAERDLFAPSYFVAISRADNFNDYAFGRRISYSKVTGELVVALEQTFGAPGPFSDWEISVGAGITAAVAEMLDQAKTARDLAIANAATTTTERTAAQAAKTAAETAKTAAQAALTSFNSIYYGARSGAPSGAVIGSFYYDTDDQVFKVLGSSGWTPGHSVSFGGVVTQDYTVTDVAGQTVFTVDGGFSNIDVFKNGLQLKPVTDFTTNISTGVVTLTAPAATGAFVSVRGYKETNASSFYTKAAADTIFNTKLDKTGGNLTGPLNVSFPVNAAELKSTTGVVRLNSTGDRYLQWTGTIYQLAGAGGIWHTGNFDPNTKLDKLGGSLTGNLTFTGTLNAGNLQVNGGNVWYSGNFDPNSKLSTTGGALAGDLTIYRPGASNTGVVWLGSGTGRGLFFDGSNYQLLGQGVPWNTGNFNPNTKANLTGATFSWLARDQVSTDPTIWWHYPGVKRARWVDGRWRHDDLARSGRDRTTSGSPTSAMSGLSNTATSTTTSTPLLISADLLGATMRWLTASEMFVLLTLRIVEALSRGQEQS
jgi:hypothetical protein